MTLAVPVLDVAPLASGDPAARAEAAAAIGAASRDVGFFYVAGHGIPDAVIAAAIAAARGFFALPEDRRRAVQARPGAWGYTPLFDSTHPGQKPDATEGFEVGREAPGTSRNQWPDLPGFRDAVAAYYDAVLALGLRLMRGYALHFGLPERHFDPLFAAPIANLRLAHYPGGAAVRAVSEYGTGAHTDHGVLTLLWQDGVGGLEVCLDGAAWLPVPPRPGTLVVNLGELLTRWSGGRLRSTLHRVHAPAGVDRLSMPFFLYPGADVVIDPADLPSTPPGARDRHPPVTCAAYMRARFAGYRAAYARDGKG